MATAIHIPVSEYLKTTYRPDCDYIDGEVRERNVGEQPHGDLQMILGTLFRTHRLEWGVRPLGDTRLQITASRYRIPDVMVLRNTDPKHEIVAFAPLVCIEILSHEDRLNEIRQRVGDYMSVGTSAVWVIDPWRRVAYVETSEGLREPADGTLRVNGTAIEVSIADIFAQLDEF